MAMFGVARDGTVAAPAADVPADPGERSATEALNAAGGLVEVNCPDGVCGVCAAACGAARRDACDHGAGCLRCG